MLAVILAAAGDVHAQSDRDKPDEAPTVRVVGPLAAKEPIEALGRAFSRRKPIVLDYVRVDSPPAAAGALLVGRDAMFCFGPVAADDLGYFRARWKQLAPAEHMVGALAVAVVVHERVGVESLTLDQLKAVFSGEASDWAVFGGPRRPIRCYGPAFDDPAARLFHERVLPAGKCRMLVRRKSSPEVLKSLSGDPGGIGFVSAAATASAGRTIRIVPIGPPSASVPANAQTVKDGTYPLARRLMLYVSPEASSAGKELAQYIVDGRGDAVLREHGFLPTLRAAGGDVLAAFEKLYGPDVRRVRTTPDGADDLELAGRLIRSARTARLGPELVTAMCETAHDLAADVSGGVTTAFEALDVLTERAPGRRFDCALKRAALCQRVYGESGLRADGQHLVSAWMEAGELGTSARRFTEAADAWRKALELAEEIDSAKLETIRERLPAFAARVESLRKADALAARLREDPADADTRRRMLTVRLVELDDPAGAADYLDAAPDEQTRTNVPLATQPPEKLSAETALRLAEWYVGLVDRAGVGGRELMAARARTFYLRFFELHESRDDLLAMRAALGLNKVGGRVPDPPQRADPGDKPSAPRAISGKAGEMTDLKLAEFVAAHPDLTRLTHRQIGAAGGITDLRPIARLRQLKALELRNASGVKDLSPLARLPELTSLTLTGLVVKDVSELGGLSKLTALNIAGARNVTDLSPVGRLRRLRSLNLSGCVKVEDLRPLSRLAGLRSLNLSGCKAVENVAPLEPLSRALTSLNLSSSGVVYVPPLSQMTRLKTLDVRRCENVSADDAAWLAKHLPDCKVLSDAPAKQPSSADPQKW